MMGTVTNSFQIGEAFTSSSSLVMCVSKMMITRRAGPSSTEGENEGARRHIHIRFNGTWLMYF